MNLKTACWPIGAVGLAIMAVMTVAGFQAIVRPIEEQRIVRETVQSELAERQQRATASERALKGLQRQLADAQLALRERDLQLQPLHSLNNRMAQITELVEGTGMVIHETELGEARAGQFFQRVPIQISGEGTYRECAVFLDRVHQGVPDLGIVAFELAGAPGSSESPRYRFDLEWYAAPAVTAAVE